ncbi:MAG: type II toxin-antitoxin system VapC family toxin [Gammaproteobacteria bacterium]|nr:type II toxin-antitoxin system VapC family toxin [Gammaproteobacteria bacterium]
MTSFLLDTNTISHLVKGHPALARRITTSPMAALGMSAITAGELLFGLAKRPGAKRLHTAVRELLRRVDVLPWNHAVAERYGFVRADMERQGNVLAALDMLIAAHALEVGAVLVTNDGAFRQVAGLNIEDWTKGRLKKR